MAKSKALGFVFQPGFVDSPLAVQSVDENGKVLGFSIAMRLASISGDHVNV